MSQNSKLTTKKKFHFSTLWILWLEEDCLHMLLCGLYRTVNEHRPTPLDATSEPPPLFDGTTRFTLLSPFLFVYFWAYSVFVFVLFTVFTICRLGCFIPYILKWTWTFFSFFSFFFSKVVHQLCMPICTACVDHQELQGYFHDFS